MKKFVLTTSIVSLSLLSQAQISLFNNEVEQQWHEISFMVNQGTVNFPFFGHSKIRQI